MLRWSLAGLCVIACVSTEPSPPKARRTQGADVGGGLFASPQEMKLRGDLIQARELEASLESLPGVVSARVHLTTPQVSLLSKTSDNRSGAAVLLVRDNDANPPRDDVRAFLVAAVPSLSPDAVQVFINEERTPAATTVQVGPIEVSEASAPKARVILGGLLGLCLVASAGLILAGLKLRQLRKTER